MSVITTNYQDAEFELVGLCTDICVISNAIMIKPSTGSKGKC